MMKRQRPADPWRVTAHLNEQSNDAARLTTLVASAMALDGHLRARGLMDGRRVLFFTFKSVRSVQTFLRIVDDNAECVVTGPASRDIYLHRSDGED